MYKGQFIKETESLSNNNKECATQLLENLMVIFFYYLVIKIVGVLFIIRPNVAQVTMK